MAHSYPRARRGGGGISPARRFRFPPWRPAVAACRRKPAAGRGGPRFVCDRRRSRQGGLRFIDTTAGDSHMRVAREVKLVLLAYPCRPPPPPPAALRMSQNGAYSGQRPMRRNGACGGGGTGRGAGAWTRGNGNGGGYAARRWNFPIRRRPLDEAQPASEIAQPACRGEFTPPSAGRNSPGKESNRSDRTR